MKALATFNGELKVLGLIRQSDRTPQAGRQQLALDRRTAGSRLRRSRGLRYQSWILIGHA